jgi:hypothetical protein
MWLRVRRSCQNTASRSSMGRIAITRRPYFDLPARRGRCATGIADGETRSDRKRRKERIHGANRQKGCGHLAAE